MFGIEDPSSLLRPWKNNLQQFSEELYAMLKPHPVAGSGDSGTGPRTSIDLGESPSRSRSNTEPQVGINSIRETRIEQARSRVTLPDAKGVSSHGDSRKTSLLDSAPEAAGRLEFSEYRPFEAPPAPDARRAKQGDGTTEQSQSSARAVPDIKRSTPTTPSSGHDASPSREFSASEDFRPSSRDEPEFKYTTDIGDFANQVGGGGGDASVFVGKVMSGFGAAYKVELYPSGLTADPGDTVDVIVPVIADGEQIPAGSTIVPIVQAGDLYYYQPPVWMD